MAIDDDTLQILGRSAVLAGSYGLTNQAGEIAAALREMVPGDEDVQILHAAALMRADEFDKARAILKFEVLMANPDNMLAKSMLAVVAHFRREEAERDSLINEVIDAGDGADEDAVALVRELADA